MSRTDNVLNMQITIANCMRQEWKIDLKDLFHRTTYDLSEIDVTY